MKRYSYAIAPQPLEEAIAASLQGMGSPTVQPLQQAIMESASKAPVLPPESITDRQTDGGGWNLATATSYNGDDDQFGSTTARKNPMGESKAIEGQTIAVDPSLIPYGSRVEVQLKDGTIKTFFAHDTGSAVKARTASIGRKNLDAEGNPIPVLDFYTPQKDLIAYNDKIGNVVKWRIVAPTTLASNP